MTTRHRRRRPRWRYLLAAAVTLLATTSSYALTAANTVPNAKAGAGSAGVTAFTVTAPTYAIDVADNPKQLLSSALKLGGAAPGTTQVRVQFRSAGSWYACTLGAYNSADDTTDVSCSVAPESSLTANQLTVVAAQ